MEACRLFILLSRFLFLDGSYVFCIKLFLFRPFYLTLRRAGSTGKGTNSSFLWGSDNVNRCWDASRRMMKKTYEKVRCTEFGFLFLVLFIAFRPQAAPPEQQQQRRRAPLSKRPCSGAWRCPRKSGSRRRPSRRRRRRPRGRRASRRPTKGPERTRTAASAPRLPRPRQRPRGRRLQTPTPTQGAPPGQKQSCSRQQSCSRRAPRGRG